MSLPWFIQAWLANAARQTLNEKLSETAEQLWQSRRAIPDFGCDVGLIFALEAESGVFQDRLSKVAFSKGNGFAVRQGLLGEQRIVLMQSGVGRDRAARAATALLDGHRPPWVISAGFAGGLADGLARHDLLLVNEVIDLSGRRLSIPWPLDPASLADARTRVGRLLTGDAIVRRPANKRQLGQQYQAVGIDMETAAVAEVCHARGVPLVALRVISDAVDDELPPEVDNLVRQQTGAARLGAALGALWRRPGSVKDLWKLQETALEAARRLADAIQQIIGRFTTAER